MKKIQNITNRSNSKEQQDIIENINPMIMTTNIDMNNINEKIQTPTIYARIYSCMVPSEGIKRVTYSDKDNLKKLYFNRFEFLISQAIINSFEYMVALIKDQSKCSGIDNTNVLSVLESLVTNTTDYVKEISNIVYLSMNNPKDHDIITSTEIITNSVVSYLYNKYYLCINIDHIYSTLRDDEFYNTNLKSILALPMILTNLIGEHLFENLLLLDTERTEMYNTAYNLKRTNYDNYGDYGKF